jgi:hypothetical protein
VCYQCFLIDLLCGSSETFPEHALDDLPYIVLNTLSSYSAEKVATFEPLSSEPKIGSSKKQKNISNFWFPETPDTCSRELKILRRKTTPYKLTFLRVLIFQKLGVLPSRVETFRKIQINFEIISFFLHLITLISESIWKSGNKLIKVSLLDLKQELIG